MTRFRALTILLVGWFAVSASGTVRAEDEPPTVIVHVPVDEMDVLLEMDRRGVVLRYDEYLRLLGSARERARTEGEQPPVEGVLVSAEGTLDLSQDGAAAFEVTYRAEVLASGPSVVPFPVVGLALDEVVIEGGGTYEEMDGRGRLRFAGPGVRTLRLTGAAAPKRDGERRILAARLPPASGMALEVRLPPASTGTLEGEGPAVPFQTPPQAAVTRSLRPERWGWLRVTWEPSQRGTEGPPVLDVETKTLHGIEDGLVRSKVLVHVDVLRRPTDTLRLTLPPESALRAVGGDGVARSARSDDRTQLVVDLARETRGRVTLSLDLETPYRPEPDTALPAVHVEGALRERGEVGIRVGRDVVARGVEVSGGERLPALPSDPSILRYALVRSDAAVSIDLTPGVVELDAVSTYYLNLTEPARTLLAAITYRVRQGTAYRLAPSLPGGWSLRTVTLNGQATGFRRDLGADGTLDIQLDHGVAKGGEIALLATLEETGVDWVPEEGAATLAWTVPSAGALREEGYVGIGADASFRVLDTEVRGLEAVGAADLTSRGVSPVGLVYGYRLDGEDAFVRLEVERRIPRIDAAVLSGAQPSARRLDVESLVVHRIDRAGVRRLVIDCPTWARDTVRMQGDAVVSWHRAEPADDRPADLPEGYDRWNLVLGSRVLGTHRTRVTYHEDQTREDWRVPVDRPLAVSVPVAQLDRSVVVLREPGLEVRVEGGVERDVADLPPDLAVNPLEVRELVRVPEGTAGPGIAVVKHEGAEVVEAIAAEVHLDTSVAKEGILRTRADVSLVNTGLQFLRVALPPGSELVGAVVDQQPVKPLADADGTLRVPIPPTRAQGARTTASITFVTPLSGPVHSEVEIPTPRFPGLEVLHTTLRAAFDREFEIRGVAGDFAGTTPLGHERWTPWIAGLFRNEFTALRAPAAEGGAPMRDGPVAQNADSRESVGLVIRNEATADRVETDNDVPFEESLGEAGLTDAPFTGRGPPMPSLDTGERVPPGRREPSDATPPAPPPASGPPAAIPPMEPEPAPSGNAGASVGIGGGAGGRFGGEEGPGREPPRPTVRRTRQGRGLLSLDVPVLLQPHIVQAQRLGGGGTFVVSLATRDGRENLYYVVGLLAAALGLGLAVRSRLLAFVVPVSGFLLALLVIAVFGRAGALWATALVDAMTLLLALLFLRFLVRRFARVPRVSTAALLLCGIALFSARAAHAEGDGAAPVAPAPSSPPVRAPHTVYVPYDPSDPTVPHHDDRIFLPLETFLALRKAADPDVDPDVLRHGHVVTMTSARYDLVVDETEASGTARYTFEKRGGGLHFHVLDLAGLAVTDTLLDGRPAPLRLDEGRYRVALESEGTHELRLNFRVPVTREAAGRRVAFRVPTFAGARMSLRVRDFDGEVLVAGAGRVTTRQEAGRTLEAQVALGAVSDVRITLDEPEAREPTVALRTRAESRIVHSVRRGGTESVTEARLIVLQGEARHVDVALAPGLSVVDAGGGGVARWETGDGRVRLVFATPQQGEARVFVRVLRPADGPERVEELPPLAVRDTTGERGEIVVNGEPSLRVEHTTTDGLFRTAMPRDELACGIDRIGRVASAWRFASRPTRMVVSVEEIAPMLSIASSAAVAFGDDRVRSRIEATVTIDPRVPVGSLVFDLPGRDVVRTVDSAGLETWWLEGEGDDRSLHLRYADLRTGTLSVRAVLELGLDGRREAIEVSRWVLRGATRDQGTLVLYAMPDVELFPGGRPGLRAVLLSQIQAPTPPVAGAEPRVAYRWEEPVGASLPVNLGTPSPESEAVVISSVQPGDEVHRIDHLVVFDVTRGARDRFAVFVPDGGQQDLDVVRTQDLREVREERVTRTGADGADVAGVLYDVRLQGDRSGLVEITISQRTLPGRPVRVVRPEGASGVRWFELVRTFLDGVVQVETTAGTPDPVDLADLPFLPTGIGKSDVYRSVSSRAPFVLEVEARRRAIRAQADAVVHAARATVVVGLDGDARVRASYRIFNRSRQFLPIHLPKHAVLYSATAAGRIVKPLEGEGGSLLVPVPKVPLGGTGYEVSVLYRAPGGAALAAGELALTLPEVPGVTVDRTLVDLYLPEGYTYDIDTELTRVDRHEVAAELAAAALTEAKALTKVAETGNLQQRALAAENARALVQYAGDLVGEQTKAGVGREVLQVQRESQEQWNAVQQDIAAARRRDRQRGLELSASNAFSAISEQPEAETEATGAATWFFNGLQVDQAGEKREFAELKQRYEQALEERGQRQRQGVDPRNQREARYLDESHSEYAGPALSKNFEDLNDLLQEDQGRNRQLVGDEATRQQAGQVGFTRNDNELPYRLPPPGDGAVGYDSGIAFQDRENLGRPGAGTLVTLDDVTAGLEDSAGDGVSGAALNPSAGVSYNDGAEGDYRGRTANVFGQTFAVDTRRGLMGVDVPLPTEGEVFQYRGLRAGATIHVRATKDEPNWAGRWLLFLALIGGIAYGAWHVTRK